MATNNTMSAADIQKQMDANSAAWHNASTQAEKDALHAANVKLASQLNSNASFDSGTGTWSGLNTGSKNNTNPPTTQTKTNTGGSSFGGITNLINRAADVASAVTTKTTPAQTQTQTPTPTQTQTQTQTQTTAATTGVDSNINYQAKINEAVAKGDYASAAKYEQLRNQKIRDNNLASDTIKETNYYQDFANGNLGAATKTTVNRNGETLNGVVINGKTYLTDATGAFTGGGLEQGDQVTAANGTVYYYDKNAGKGLTAEDYMNATKTATKTTTMKDIRTGKSVVTTDYTDGFGNSTRVATVDGIQVPDGYTIYYATEPDGQGFEYEVMATWDPNGGEDGKGGWTETVSPQPTQESYQNTLDQMYNDYLAAIREANNAAVDLSVKEIEANLENGLEKYSQDAAEAYLKMLQSQQNQAQRSAANGDLGGIGQKQYSAAESQYDAALLQIALEKEAFINSCNQQIEQLKAQGRLQDAQLLADWAQSKLDRYDNDYKWYQEMLLKEKQVDYQQSAEDREFAYNRAMNMLNKGILTGDVLETLGISKEDAQRYADMLNDEAQVSLAYSKAQLDALVNKNAGMTYGGSGGGGGGSGGSGGGYGGTPSYDSAEGTSGQPIGTVQVVGKDGAVRTANVYGDGTVDGLQAGDSFTMDGETYTFDGSQIRNGKEAAGVNTWLGNAQTALGITRDINANDAAAELQRRANNLQAHIAETKDKLGQYSVYGFDKKVQRSGLTQGERYLTGLSQSEAAAYDQWVSLTAELERYQQNLDTYNGLLKQYQQYR